MLPARYLKLLLFCVLILSGCTKYVSFDIKTPAIKTGTFIIKNTDGQMVYSGNIKDGQLKLDKQMLERADYYNLFISDDAVKAPPVDFEIYLEPGDYTIVTQGDKSNLYPQITSPSAIQKELSAYYAFELKYIGRKDNFKIFLQQYPESISAAHIMAGIDYEEDPAYYYPLFKTLTEQARNSYEGKEIGKKLDKLMKLQPGALAPEIAGTTPDGKPFKISDLNKRIYVVEFWKSGNELSRTNHSGASVTNMLSTVEHKKDVGVISVSLDEKRDWWTTAIKDDELTWTQYSDLKGNDSPNAANWAIKRIPTYDLVDGNWHIIQRDVPWMELSADINTYLKHH